MAEAVGKATGRPGVCFVTRGPGAHQRRPRRPHRPAELHADDPVRRPGGPRRATGRDAWQELDYAAVFGSMTKWAAEIDDPARDAASWSRAPSTSPSTASPGPVVLALPHDMLIESASTVADAPPAKPVEASPGAAEMAPLERCWPRRRRRSCCWAAAAGTRRRARRSTRFAERFDLPVATGFRRLPLFDPLHPNYAGDLGLGANPKLVARVKAADLVLVDRRRPQRRHHAGLHACSTFPRRRPSWCTSTPTPTELGRVWRPHLAINATPDPLRRRAAKRWRRRRPAWRGSAAAAHAEYLAWSEVADAAAGRGEPRRDHGLAARAPAGGRDPHQRRRQLRRLGQPLLPRAPLRRPPRAELRLDGLRRAGGGGHAAALSRAGAWWRSAATATS